MKNKKENLRSSLGIDAISLSRPKRAVSAVVATVLIILITVAAITIIWAAIIPMIKNQISGGQACLDAISQVSLVTQGGYTCWDDTNDIVQIQVSHGAKKFDLADIQVLISEGGSSTSKSALTDATPVYVANSIGPNAQKIIKIPYTPIGTGPTKVEIAPIVTIGSTSEKCEVSAEAVLNPCTPA